MQEKTMSLKALQDAYREGKDLSTLGKIAVNGWVRTNRDNGQVGFIILHDGSQFKNLQLVYDGKNYELCKKIPLGASLLVRGEMRMTPEMKQPYELHVDEIEVLGDVDPEYPLQKKKTSLEFLREIPYLRPRTNTFDALYRLRSVLAMGIHTFFQERGFVYVHTPEITANDAEGAGQVFTICTEKDGKLSDNDFYGRRASLTVSGQLHVEAFALAFKNVYTFGPTFRAEKSNTPRHGSEFWMIEPELAFADLDDDMECIESCIKFCIDWVYEKCPDEMEFFATWIDKGLKEKLDAVRKAPFRKMEYTEGIKILQDAVKNGHKFVYNDIKWGMDLQSEHERYLTEEVVKGPLFLINYPKEIKAFYMRDNDDGKTVAAVDLLVPGEGEIVGGSQREERYDILKAKMDKIGNTQGLEWYLNLRKYGGCKHAGFGIGFDRLLMYLTGVSNIRDTEPYPRTSSALKY